VADNVTVINDSGNTGVDYVVSTDDAGADGQVQRVKLTYSADGAATHVPADADGLLVNLGANNDVVVSDGGGSITVDGTVSVTEPVSVDDNGGSLTVDGTVTANAGTGPWPVTDNGGSLTVDGSVSVTGSVDTELPAAAALADNAANPTAPAVGAFGLVWDGATWDRAPGSSADGTLVNLGANNDVTLGAALPAGTNNIGDVDVLTVPAPLSTTGGGTEATALRVTVANDSTGVLSVDDNGGSLTVDGTVTANQGAAGTAWEVVGDVAQDAAIAGNPLPTGLRASDAEPTAMSADGDAVYGWGDRSGRFVTTQKAGTATLSNVSDSATSVTVLAANTARVGATIYNDSTSTLYLKLGSTASTTSFTAKLFQDGYYEVPFGYTGVIDGIWSADSSGAARVTEIT
jgi:hypothetical protein